MMINVAILGGSGYGGGELLRLLTQHPSARVVAVTSSSQVGEPVVRSHPHLRGFCDLKMVESIDFHRFFDADCAVAFSSLPHGTSGVGLDRLIDEASKHAGAAKLRAIDLSGDLRLADQSIHESHYPESPALPHRRSSFQYGLPELFRDEIGGARFIANPGCLATASILAVAPLLRTDFQGAIAVDAKTGSSGAGRQLKETTHHPTRHADFRAYKPLAHQHEPEILQAWGDSRGERITLSFVAQSMDVSRGIFVTAHLTLPAAADRAALEARYREFYARSPFVRIVDDSPALQNVVGSNFCDIAIASRGRQVIAMAAIDNLVKGMAGAAIQNMNLMCGLPETTGLWAPSIRPL